MGENLLLSQVCILKGSVNNEAAVFGSGAAAATGWGQRGAAGHANASFSSEL